MLFSKQHNFHNPFFPCPFISDQFHILSTPTVSFNNLDTQIIFGLSRRLKDQQLQDKYIIQINIPISIQRDLEQIWASPIKDVIHGTLKRYKKIAEHQLQRYKCNSACQTSIILYKLVEKMGKKLKCDSNRQIQSSSEEPQSHKKNKVRKLNKKLAKAHRKDKGKICRSQLQSSCLVQGSLHRMASTLSTPRQQILPHLRGKFNKIVHVKNIIDKDVARCFLKTKEIQQDCIKAYKELIILGGYYPQIETIGIKSLTKGTPMSISYLKDRRANLGPSQAHSRRILQPNEVTLIQRRQQLMSQIVTFVQGQQLERGYPLEPVDEVLLEILTLCKLNASVQSQIKQDLERLMERQDLLFECHQVQEIQRRQRALRCEYAQAQVVKNLMLSLDERPIDFLNYHLGIQKYQENGLVQEKFPKLGSFEQFKHYVETKKPKSRKSSKYLLKTPCTACFSHFFEVTNPILNCPECHMRVHQSCQNLQNRCHRCRYSRTSNKEKHLSSYCYICHRENEKGTMIQTVTNQYPHQYAHSYCLLLHKYWKIQEGAVKGNFVPSPQQQQFSCQICGKNKGHFFKSTCCGIKVHGMCAYLEGCSLKMKKGVRNDYQIEVKCCVDPQVRERLLFERRFKLNWQKVIFRQDPDLNSYIRERIQRYDIEE